jgi:hypothetical protein
VTKLKKKNDDDDGKEKKKERKRWNEMNRKERKKRKGITVRTSINKLMWQSPFGISTRSLSNEQRVSWKINQIDR